ENYPATVMVSDVDGGTISTVSTTLAVADAALSDTTAASSTVNATEGNAFSNLVLMTFDDNNPSATASDFSVTSVSYTNSPSFTSGPTYTVQANVSAADGETHFTDHARGPVAASGNNVATVNVSDADGST